MRHYLLFLSFLILELSFAQSPEFSSDLANNESCGPSIITYSIDDLTDIDSYSWDFGNGENSVAGTITPSNQGIASTTYKTPGNYTVKLTINGLLSSEQEIEIHAFPEPNFTVTENITCIKQHQAISFTYTGTLPEYGAAPVEWIWNFGDETMEVHSNSPETITHNYSKPGIFTVLLTVIDANGCEKTIFKPDYIQLSPTPSADFEMNYQESCNFPLDIQLTDKSKDTTSAPIARHNWTITRQSTGEIMATSHEKDPTLSITTGGRYDITLEVISLEGKCSDEITQSISFTGKIVDFSPDTNTAICQGQSVHFTNLSTKNRREEPVSYLWEFGDGTTDTVENPTHEYTTINGSPYTVTLSATFSNGCQTVISKSDLITINPAGASEFTVDQDGSCDDYTATFTAIAGAVLYEWDFDYEDRPNFTVSGPENRVTHDYQGEGNRQVYLQVTTAAGCILEATYDSIRILYPAAHFAVTSGKTGCLDELAQFDASSTSNTYPIGNENIIEYRWDFENDGIDDYSSPTPTAEHMYNEQGLFSVKLTVVTAQGCEENLVRKNLVERGLSVGASFTYTQSNTCRQTPVLFTNTSEVHPSSKYAIDKLVWRFGDGAVLSGNPQLNSSLNRPTHLYNDDTMDDGTPFTASLTTYTNGCSQGTTEQQIEICLPIARVDKTAPQLCAPDEIIHFEAYDLNKPTRLSEGVEKYRWEFGDGGLYPGPTKNDYATGFNPTIEHTYTNPGLFTYTLFVKSADCNCEDSYSEEIGIYDGLVTFSANDTIVCASDSVASVTFTNNSTSTAPEIEYHWDFGLGAQPATYIGDNPPAIMYSTPGKATVSLLMIQDGGCELSSVQEKLIDIRGPIADFEWTSENNDDSTACIAPSQKLTFRSTTTPNENHTFIWNFGEGAIPATAIRSTDNPIDVIYSTSGEKIISLEVIDTLGCSIYIQKEKMINIPHPIANFATDAEESYCINENVIFNDLSKETAPFTIQQWQWDFGQGATPATFSGQNPPAVSYSTTGSKEISLQITNNKGCVDIFTNSLDIYEANALFSSTFEVSCAPAKIAFTDSSQNVDSWHWDFGDGKTSRSQDPKHLYLYPGKYFVTLTTTSLGGCSFTYAKPEAILISGTYYSDLTYTIDQHCLASPQNPIVNFSINGLIDVKTITFDFGDGSPAYVHVFKELMDSVDHFELTHTYTSTGTFAPKITLEDDIQQPAACGAFVFIPDVEPIIISMKPSPNFTHNTIDGEGCQDKEIKFTDTSKLNDEPYPITSWRWDFGDGSSASTQDANHTYSTAGLYTVSLTVNTTMGCDTSYQESITINVPIIDTSPSDTISVCDMTPPLLEAHIPSGGNGQYAYQWQQSTDHINWTIAQGINNKKNYQVERKNNTTKLTFYYRRKTTSSTCDVISNTFKVTIYPETQGGQLNNAAIECYDNNNGALALTNNIGAVLEWESSTDSLFSTVTSISNTSNTLSYNNLTETTYYRVKVQSELSDIKYSDSIAIRVNGPIEITQQPNDVEVCSSDNAQFFIEANSHNTGTLVYQWQRNNEDIPEGGDFSGTQTALLTINNVLMYEADSFRVLVRMLPCNDVVSETHLLTVTRSPDTLNLALSMRDICQGNDALVNISGQLSEGHYSVNYKLSGSNLLDETTEISIAADGTGSLLIPAGQLLNEGKTIFTLNTIARTDSLRCETLINLNTSFFVVSLTHNFEAHIDIDDICVENSAIARLSTSLADNDYLIDYQISGANNQSIIGKPITLSGGMGEFVITNASLSSPGVQSISITAITLVGVNDCSMDSLDIANDFNIEAPIVIVSQPETEAQCHGNPISLTIDVEMPIVGDVFYTWQISEDGGESYVDLYEQGIYSNTETSMLNISDNTELNGKLYHVIVSSSQCAYTTSNTVLLEVYTGSHCGEGLDHLPNGFSPNGDGVNDYWHIEGIQFYTDCLVRVYSETGSLVYESKAYDNTSVRFDGIANKGNNKGKELDDDTYLYTIDLHNGSKLLKNFLVIKR
ncbi:MAG: PKD domain-containing protein [Bacteroidales bacterium]|jgi:gliding motility-associated-like protein|nr:PKD domain-containing protein [Bacteroidales bacterium]